MAGRNYAKVWLTIWNDPDFQTRTSDGQWLYFTLLTHPLLNACGIAPWREPKLVKMAGDMTIDRLRAAASNLAEVCLIAVDVVTEEVLVRSFVRHDGLLQSPNMTVGMVREHAATASLMLKALVSREVRRAIQEHPEWKGLAMAGPVAKQFPEADDAVFEMVPEGFRKGSDSVPEGFENGSDSVPSEIPQKEGNPSDLVPLSLNPQPSTPVSSDTGTARAASASRRKPEVPIPDAWAPGPRHRDQGRLLHVDVDREAFRFRNHAEANDRRARDWDAAFRNWLDKSGERAAPTDRNGRRVPDVGNQVWMLG